MAACGYTTAGAVLCVREPRECYDMETWGWLIFSPQRSMEGVQAQSGTMNQRVRWKDSGGWEHVL